MITRDGIKNTFLHPHNLYLGYICNCQLANIMLHLIQAYLPTQPNPTQPSKPTEPTNQPSKPTNQPTNQPTNHPSNQPTNYMQQSPTWEAHSSSASQEIPPLYGTQSFISEFTRACHLLLSWARSIQSMPQSHFLKIHFNITLSLIPTSFKRSLPLRFPPKKTNLSSPPYMLHVQPTQIIFGEETIPCLQLNSNKWDVTKNLIIGT